MKRFSRNIVITGSSSGIGKALKEAFIKNGDKVVGISTHDDDFCCDVTDRAALEKVFEQIGKKFDKIDVLIPCAGFGLLGAIELTPYEKVKKEYEVNVLGLISVIQLGMPLMRETGRIINISSVCAIFPLPFRAFYCSSKAAVSMLSDCLRMELANTKIQSTAICPCEIKTNFSKNRDKNFETNERYGRAIELASNGIAARENKRMELDKACKIIMKIINKKRLRPEYVMGAGNKTLNFVKRFFPKSWLLNASNKVFFKKK